MTLFEMSEAARQLYDLLEAGEIDEQTVTDTMESIGASEKLESYIHVQRQIESEIAAFDAEIDRMTERKNSLKKQVERLKSATVDFMRATNQKSANAGTFKLTMRENKSCEITDESMIPAEYMTIIPESKKPDKRAMLAALKDGAEIAGAQLKTSYSVTAK
jgi:archaellum component FlaC